MRPILIAVALAGLAGCSAPMSLHTGPAIAPVQFAVGPQTTGGILYRPGDAGRWPGLIVVHEDQGLNAWTKEQAAKYAGQGYVVLAVDLFDGKVFTDVMDAHIMESRLEGPVVVGKLKAAVDFLAARREVLPDRIAILGWGAGGGYALDAAIHDPRLVTAVVCYGRVPTEPASVANLQGSVLGIFAEKDLGITRDTLKQFEAAMGKAGKRLAGVHIFVDMPHGFLNVADPRSASPAQLAAIEDARFKINWHLNAELCKERP